MSVLQDKIGHILFLIDSEVFKRQLPIIMPWNTIEEIMSVGDMWDICKMKYLCGKRIFKIFLIFVFGSEVVGPPPCGQGWC